MPVLCLKPHLAAHVLSAEEVVLLGEGGRFVLRGKAYAAVVPLLDGKRSDDEIAAGLAGQVEPALVYHALAELEARGYARPVVSPPADPAADAWWSGHGVGPDISGELSLARSTRLVDAGAHPPAFAALAAVLEAAAKPPSSRPSEDARQRTTTALTVVATGDYLDERLAAAVRATLREGGQALPVRLAGASVWIGPLLDGTNTGLFDILYRRLAANRPADVTVRSRGADFPLLPVQGLPVTFDLAAAWIASAALTIAAGSPSPFLNQGVITLDPWTLETRRHPVSVAASASVSAAPKEAQPITLAPAAKRFVADGGHRTCSPDETLARLEPLVSPIAGIVPEVEKMQTPAGIHVYVCRQVFQTGKVGPRDNRVLGRATGALGKGASDIQARVSCLAEAVERYSCGWFDDEKRNCARLGETPVPAVDPRALLLFSDAQYDDRDRSNRLHGRGFNWIPERFDPARAIDWSPAWSLTRQSEVWLPTAFCHFGYLTAQDHEFCRADSNGCAAGNTLEEAIQQGFLELVERDACALWWYNRARRPGIDIASFGDPFLDAMTRTFDARGRELVALDITSDLGIPVVMAVSWRRDDGGRILLGLGCHLEPRLAVSRALAELNQGAVAELAEGEALPAAGLDDMLARWLATATAENQPYLRPADGPHRSAVDFVDLSTPDVRDDLLMSMEALRRKGLEMIVVDHTRPDIGFPVVRVVVPGLRHFWARRAPGRLYDVPVELGWRDQQLAESDLNPIAFFL